MKYTENELRSIINSSFAKDTKAKAAAGVQDSIEEFNITNITANIRVIADLLCRMQSLLSICNDVYKDLKDFNVYEQAWNEMVADMEWIIEYYDKKINDLIDGGENDG